MMREPTDNISITMPMNLLAILDARPLADYKARGGVVPTAAGIRRAWNSGGEL